MSKNYPDFYDNDSDEVEFSYFSNLNYLHELNTGMDIDGSGWMDNSFGF